MKPLKITLSILAVLLALTLVILAGCYGWFRFTHVKVNGVLYDTGTEAVDLTGQDISFEDYNMLREALPSAVITWDVPFQDTRISNTAQEITVKTLTMEDLEVLHHLPGLTHVDALECRDYEALLALEEQMPNCQVDFKIHLGDQALDRDVRSLKLQDSCGVTTEELKAALQYLPELTSIFLENPSVPAKELYAFQEQHPDITITWNKKFMDQVYEMDLEELELINRKDVGTIEELEATLAYFPDFKKIYLEQVPYTNEELAALRERVRDQYQVVWMVYVGQGHLRTDDIGFIPSNSNWRVTNEETYNLRYCEGLLAVDFGHTNTGNLEWVVGTPHLKYLIVGDGNVFNKDIANLSCLKELEFLEIFNCPVTDVSPLKECTALRDLLLSNCYIDPAPLAEMPWLENLWLSGSGLNYKEKEFLAEKLPNTYIMSAGTGGHGYGWRDLPRYFDMRDTLGMWYMKG